jgi:hypothetical protein
MGEKEITWLTHEDYPSRKVGVRKSVYGFEVVREDGESLFLLDFFPKDFVQIVIDSPKSDDPCAIVKFLPEKAVLSLGANEFEV